MVNIGGQGQDVAGMAKFHATQSKENAGNLANRTQDVRNLLDDIQEEVAGKRTNLTQDESSATDTTTVSTQHDKQQAQRATTVSARDQSQVQDPTAEAAAHGALEQDDTIKKKKKKISLKEKLKMLAKFEALLGDVEFEDPEDQATIEAFLNNLGRMNNMQGELNQLTRQEAYYEELLKEQEDGAKDNKDKDSNQSQNKDEQNKDGQQSHNSKEVSDTDQHQDQPAGSDVLVPKPVDPQYMAAVTDQKMKEKMGLSSPNQPPLSG